MIIHGGPLARSAITRNTIWNFIGSAAPVPVALIAIPVLISRLGVERFGLLGLAWAVMGYFTLFDFGLARATTKFVAEAWHHGDAGRVRQLFWTSLSAHLLLGMVGGALLAVLATPIEHALTIRPQLRPETVATLYLLALSVPVIILTSAARGVLEAVQRFDLVNLVKVPASVVTYLGPLLALVFTTQLPLVIVVIVISRVIVLLAYLVMCFRVLPSTRWPSRPDAKLVKPMAALGGWLTTTSLMTPILVSLDRFVIGSAVSVSAVAVYTAPYEVVTKLWVLSASLLGVLFPAFSVMVNERDRLERLYRQAIAALFFLTTLVAGGVIAFAPQFLHAWLGPDLAEEGATVARWLTVGVLVNVVAQVPFTVLQATGHADITAKLQLAQLPFYAIGAWFAAQRWGVAGVAVIWAVRAAVDAALMFGAAAARRPELRRSVIPPPALQAALGASLYIIWCWKALDLFGSESVIRVLLLSLGVGSFMWASWRPLMHGFTLTEFRQQ